MLEELYKIGCDIWEAGYGEDEIMDELIAQFPDVDKALIREAVNKVVECSMSCD